MIPSCRIWDGSRPRDAPYLALTGIAFSVLSLSLKFKQNLPAVCKLTEAKLTRSRVSTKAENSTTNEICVAVVVFDTRLSFVTVKWTPNTGRLPFCPGGTGYPFHRRFLERGIIFRTHESTSFVSSHLKLFKDRLLLKIRFSALTSRLL